MSSIDLTSFHISNIGDVRTFIKYLVDERHLIFHPDDNFAEILDEPDATECNRLMDECFRVVGDKVYSITLDTVLK